MHPPNPEREEQYLGEVALEHIPWPLEQSALDTQGRHTVGEGVALGEGVVEGEGEMLGVEDGDPEGTGEGLALGATGLGEGEGTTVPPSLRSTNPCVEVDPMETSVFPPKLRDPM